MWSVNWISFIVSCMTVCVFCVCVCLVSVFLRVCECVQGLFLVLYRCVPDVHIVRGNYTRAVLCKEWSLRKNKYFTHGPRHVKSKIINITDNSELKYVAQLDLFTPIIYLVCPQWYFSHLIYQVQDVRIIWNHETALAAERSNVILFWITALLIAFI